MRRKIEKFTKNKFLQGSLILTFTNFLVGFLNYFFNSLSAKVLGPKGYGEIITFFSYSIVLSVPIAVFTADIIRRLGEKGDKKIDAWLSWRIWFLDKINKYKFFIVPYFLFTFLFSRFSNISLMAAFSVLFGLFLSFITVFYTAGFQGLHLFLMFSVFSIIAALIKLAGPVLVYFGLDGINTVFVLLLLANAILFIASDVTIRKLFVKRKINYTIKNTAYKIVLSPLFFITLFSLIGLNMIGNIDIMFVKKFFSSENAGLYGAWSLLSKIVLYFIGALTGIIYIFFSDKQEEKNHRKILFLTITGIFLTGLIFYFTYYLFDKKIIFYLLSNRYLGILPFLSKAAIFGTFYTLITIINSYFLAKKSKLALIATAFVPFYGIFLFIFAKTITDVVNINLLIGGLIAGAYFIAALFFKEI